MGERELTTEEAIAYAQDPRNDFGPDALHVMAFSYDSDCPNYDAHVGAVIVADEGFWNDANGWGDEADATLFTDDEANTRPTLPEGTNVRWLNAPCRCWDGITIDDVETWLMDDSSTVDVAGFAEWGPFRLQWDGEDPGLPRGFSPQEALDAIHSRLEAFESGVGNNGLSLRMDRAVNRLHNFIRDIADHGSEDLEWGDPGDCWDRINSDEYEDDAALQELLKKDLYEPGAQSTIVLYAISKGYGRHYGDPHCIWCLQAS